MNIKGKSLYALIQKGIMTRGEISDNIDREFQRQHRIAMRKAELELRKTVHKCNIAKTKQEASDD